MLGWLIEVLEGRFKPWRADFMVGGLIEGLEGRFEVWRSDLRWGAADLKPGKLI